MSLADPELVTARPRRARRDTPVTIPAPPITDDEAAAELRLRRVAGFDHFFGEKAGR